MIACLDVHYGEDGACAAAVAFHDWMDAIAAEEMIVQVNEVQPYEPGQFYRRELPCLLAVIKALPPMEILIVDGHVWLDSGTAPGLGAHLFQALDGKTPVIGIAKTRFRGATAACEVLRGESRRPLYVTAVGMTPELAAEKVRSMHGEHRLPTLLKRVDSLCRHGGAVEGSGSSA